MRPRWCRANLLRTASFNRACAVYLLAYLAFSGFIYYVTLFFQNVDGWSALRTGLSWLFFCLPYFAVAQTGGQIQRRLPVAIAAGGGCFVAAVGVLGMSQVRIATPFAWPAMLLRPGGSRLRPDGAGGLRGGNGACSGRIIRHRVGPVQRLPSDRHRDRTGHPRIDRRQRDPRPLASHAGSPPGRDSGNSRSRAVRSTWPQRSLAATRSIGRSHRSSTGFEVALLLAGAILVVSGVVGLIGCGARSGRRAASHLTETASARGAEETTA